MSKFENVKRFLGEHKVEIAVIAGVGLVAIGGVAGWKAKKLKFDIPRSPMTDEFLRTTADIYRDTFGCVVIKRPIEDPITYADLGAVGERLIEEGFRKDRKITHILMIGPDMKKKIG